MTAKRHSNPPHRSPFVEKNRVGRYQTKLPKKPQARWVLFDMKNVRLADNRFFLKKEEAEKAKVEKYLPLKYDKKPTWVATADWRSHLKTMDNIEIICVYWYISQQSPVFHTEEYLERQEQFRKVEQEEDEKFIKGEHDNSY